MKPNHVHLKLFIALCLFDFGCWLERAGALEWQLGFIRQRQQAERQRLIQSFEVLQRPS